MSLITGLIWIFIIVLDFIFGVSIFALLLRVLFRALAVNPQADFINLVYSFTAPLVQPFQGILPNIQFASGVIELSTIVAIVVYILIAFVVTELLNNLRKGLQTSSTTTKTTVTTA